MRKTFVWLRHKLSGATVRVPSSRARVMLRTVYWTEVLAA